MINGVFLYHYSVAKYSSVWVTTFGVECTTVILSYLVIQFSGSNKDITQLNNAIKFTRLQG